MHNGIFIDISDRKAAETQLMLFKHAVECSSNAIGMADPQGNHIYQNQAFSQLYECDTVESFNEFGGISAVFTDPSVAQEIIEALLAGESWMGEVKQRSRTGSILPVLMRADTIKDESGTVVGLIGTTTDISNLKKAQNALAESEAKFRHLVEGANDLIYSISLDAMFTYISPQATEMLGYHPSEFIGQSPALWTHPDDLEFMTAFNLSIIETGKPRAGVEIRIKCKDGSWCWITCNHSPIKDVNGNIVGIQGMARDITDRKAAELQLKQQATELENAFQELKRTQAQMLQSEKMSSLGQMVAGVAHEINNPVNFIHGNLTHAQDYVLDLLNLISLYGEYYPTPVVEIQEKIEEIEIDFIIQDLTKIFQSMRVGTERIRTIVLSLRNFSRLDESEIKAADLHEGIDNTLMILQNRLKAKSDRPAIEVIKNYGNLPLLECYPRQLNQVFMNIFSNAIDALEDRDRTRTGEEIHQNPSQISIETELLNSQTARIRIKDNGNGIPEAIQKRIFDPFFTTKDVGKGTGLGMSISYQIITDRHQGSISFLSSPGNGAEFIIEIPTQQIIPITEKRS
ncbi:MAG: PAS domain S-box protein [Geitlerinemataceae cyanobacterium]